MRESSGGSCNAETAEESAEPPQPLCQDYRDNAFHDGAHVSAPSTARRQWKCNRPSLSEQSLAPDNAAAPLLQESWASTATEAVRGSQIHWVKGPLIGRGSLGRVFKAINQETGQLLAVKEVPINSRDDGDEEFRALLENEVRIMEGLTHPHIVTYLGHDYVDGCLYLYLEHMAGGTLTKALNDFGSFEERLIALYARQVLEGLEYLHSREPSILHRDIKGSNILIGATDSEIKLADFGCSKRTDDTLTHTMRGSIPWMAPEVIAHSRYGKPADIWSFGCVVIEMGTANVPWGKFEHQMQALVRIGLSQETPPLPEEVSATCKDFISICVQRDTERRPRAAELLQHTFLQQGN